jgi:exoribonuclease-2
MVAPFSSKDASLMGIAADFETCYQAYGEFQDRLEKYWCLRWLQQQGLPKTVFVRHLKEGMSRLEAVPLHIAIPELATHPRMTRAEVEITDLDLLQLSASARVLHVESAPAPVEVAPERGEDDASAA